MLLDPSPARIHPGKAEIGHLRPPAAAGARRRRVPPPPPRPFALDRQIRTQWLRLDRVSLRSEPLDLDPMALIRVYRFGLEVLLKSPCPFPDSTRAPD